MKTFWNVALAVFCALMVIGLIGMAEQSRQDTMKVALDAVYEVHDNNSAELQRRLTDAFLRIDELEDALSVLRDRVGVADDYATETRTLLRTLYDLKPAEEARLLQTDDNPAKALWVPDPIDLQIANSVHTASTELARLLHGVVAMQLSIARQLAASSK